MVQLTWLSLFNEEFWLHLIVQINTVLNGYDLLYAHSDYNLDSDLDNSQLNLTKAVLGSYIHFSDNNASSLGQNTSGHSPSSAGPLQDTGLAAALFGSNTARTNSSAGSNDSGSSDSLTSLGSLFSVPSSRSPSPEVLETAGNSAEFNSSAQR